jgi:hypothetical protein
LTPTPSQRLSIALGKTLALFSFQRRAAEKKKMEIRIGSGVKAAPELLLPFTGLW